MKTGVKVMDAMTRKLVKVNSEASVNECAKLMLKNGVGGVLVMDDGKLKGIVTEKDLVQDVVASNLNAKEVKVKDIMKKKIVSIDPSSDLYDALTKMSDEEVRRLPVIHKGNVIGVLTEKDILKIQPRLFDYVVEKLDLREESRKPVVIKGTCESCGERSNLYKIGDNLLCEFCSKDTERNINTA